LRFILQNPPSSDFAENSLSNWINFRGADHLTSAIADMIPDNPGIWLLHCHMPGHFSAGMRTRFQVLPK
jgi:FtsP/CotA-like multicopper oxidase with cupredoxin domain